jgi:hypothetical protein
MMPKSSIFLLLGMMACTGGGGPKDGGDDADTLDSGMTSSLPVAAEVDPECTDGAYTETLADYTVDISEEIASFSTVEPVDFLLSVLDARYPIGAYVTRGGLEESNCFDAFTSPQDTQDAEGVMGASSTVVHECGHYFDIYAGGFIDAAYAINEDLMFMCGGGNLDDTMARSDIMTDAYQDLNPGDFYANVYLTGASGNQGFNMLLEEAVQYVNSLATGYAFHDYQAWQVSERDGILTFLWYVERYLALARSSDPATYEFLTGDDCWRDAILTTWGRAWLYLELTEDISNLGIDDDFLIELVREPALLQEIQLLREADGC